MMDVESASDSCCSGAEGIIGSGSAKVTARQLKRFKDDAQRTEYRTSLTQIREDLAW